MRHPTPELLLRIAQADAYGISAEFINRHPEEPEYQELLEFRRYQGHPIYEGIIPARYTDDGQMSIAVAETLIENGAYPAGVLFAAKFFEVWNRDRRKGYSPGFQRILEESADWQDMCSRIKPISDKNGACMRAVPIGVVPDPMTAIAVAEKQAVITHNTWGGIRSAQAVALMSHYALHEPGELSELPEYVVHHLPDLDFFMNPWEGQVDWKNVGIKTAHAACTLASTKKSLLEIMRQIILWGGDTDTVAACAWGIACPRMRDEKLPEFFDKDLEPGGAYGPAFLLELGERLMKTYGG